jgi:hypothetical protein
MKTMTRKLEVLLSPPYLLLLLALTVTTAIAQKQPGKTNDTYSQELLTDLKAPR